MSLVPGSITSRSAAARPQIGSPRLQYNASQSHLHQLPHTPLRWQRELASKSHIANRPLS